MIRPQAVLVLILIIGVVLWGAHSVNADGSGAPATQALESGTSLAAVSMLKPTAAVTPTIAQESVATPPPAHPEPTAAPRPTDAPEPEPTKEPVATERPIPPDTGLAGTSLIVERGAFGRREVAFTFDAGEGAGHTEAILALLNQYGVKGSFGVTGQWVEQNPELARQIVADGHMLINHTYDHRSFTGVSTSTDPLSEDERIWEIEHTEQVILDITGYETAPYFRFPYGDYDAGALDTLSQSGFDYTFFWTCDTQGWNGFSPDEIVQICGPETDKGGSGAVLLMHVADDNDFAALPVLIEQYQRAGYDFVTMEELIQP